MPERVFYLPLLPLQTPVAFPSKKSISFPVPCAYCGVELCARTHTFDHVVPRVLGGTSAWGNLVHACYPCNAAKAARSLDDFLEAHPHLRRPLVRAFRPPAAPKPAKLPPGRDYEYIGLPGPVVGNDAEGYTYTPPRGTGVSKALRRVLKARGIAVTWLPLTA